jgi:uncharacterized membrane protein (DUF4010 family)
MEQAVIAGLAVSLGIGLLVGLERQQAMARKEGQTTPAGLRTFPLFALSGSLVALLSAGSALLPAAGLVTLVALLAAHRLGLAAAERETGVTTEAAAVVTFLLGMLAMASELVPHLQTRLALVAGVGVVVALLLSVKPKLQVVVARISETDLFATLQLLVLALVALPLLPDQGYGPFGAINPARTGRMVLLIGGVSYVGFIASRLLGTGRGLIVTGLVGGIVSSTAVTLGMARRAKDEPAVAAGCTLAIAAANAVMVARVVLLVAVLAPAMLNAVLAPLAAMLIAGVVGIIPLIRSARAAHAHGNFTVDNPFELRSAVILGVLFSGVVVVAHGIRASLGDGALVLAGLAAGLTDVDAITISTAALVHDGLPSSVGAATVLAAVASNTAMKTAIVFATGGRDIGGRMLRLNGTMLAVGAVALGALWLHG